MITGTSLDLSSNLRTAGLGESFAKPNHAESTLRGLTLCNNVRIIGAAFAEDDGERGLLNYPPLF